MNLYLTLEAQSSIWSVNIAVIMIICNLISIFIGRYSIKTRSLGPSIPILGLQGLGLPELLATTSLGHIIGAATIIGLRSLSII
uniref:Photosystem I reaction center subunit PsaK n=1 Tax=Caloglossa beccarii TaxID=131038 RepID=A0A1Z1M8D8_9FLOR|nr:photosystem I reaction center subunit X [Caloglossa beccarii]ARW62240.1 photosystem I reaction center subunit X [Caloglossa beccarii]